MVNDKRKFKHGTFKAILDVRLVMVRIVGKCLRNFLIPCFGSGCIYIYGKEEIYPKPCMFFRVQEKYNF